MHISAHTLDDLLRRLLVRLLDSGARITASRGKTTELTGVQLNLSNPRARLSRAENRRVFFSCLGELLWYLDGSRALDFIEYYVPRYRDESEDGKTVYGAYGPRLFRMRGQNQVANVISLLRERPTSRRAVIHLFDASDLASDHREVPCTCTLQFMVRGGRVLLFTSMRSNDAYFGLAHDIFAFTMLQELMARSLGVDVGSYQHSVGSLHLYDSHRKAARAYLREGWQETVSMPPMPLGDPWDAVKAVGKFEKALRLTGAMPSRRPSLDPYWMDLVRLLAVYRAFRDGDTTAIGRIKGEMSARVFDPYIEHKRRTAGREGHRSGYPAGRQS
jgi:thymidylate synthase